MALKVKNYLTLFAAWVVAQSVFFYACFYANLSTTISEWAGYTIAWPIQLFHNFVSGRPLQTSLYASPIGGAAEGFVGNPYAYIHSYVLHVTVFPYLFAYLWALRPTLGTLYTLVFAWNLGCGAALTPRILRELSPDDHRAKTVFALSVFFGAGLLGILDQFAQPLLFVGPLILAQYYFRRIRRRDWFAVAILAMCLTGEDASMMAVSTAAYYGLFEGAEGRAYGLLAGAISVPYLALALFVVQPAARADLVLSSSTNMSLALEHMLHLSPALLAQAFKTCWPLLTIFPAFVVAGLVFGWPSRRDAFAAAALGLVPTAPYWVEGFTRGGGHHILPPFLSSYLALLRLVAAGRADRKKLESRVPAAALAATAVFLLFSLRVQASNLPNALKPALYRFSGKTAKGEALALSLEVEEASNRAVIAAVKQLAPDKTLTYLTNNQAVGFFLDRTEVWQCSDTVGGRYAFEQTDYFLVQKDGINLTCCLDMAAGADFASVVKGSPHLEALNCPATPALLESIRRSFVDSGTHRVVRDDKHVLLLENRRPERFVSPPETVGWGWLRNVGKKAKRAEKK